MLSEKYARVAQAAHAIQNAVEQDAHDLDSRPTAEVLEELLAGKRDRKANVKFVCALLRAENLERFEKFEQRVIDLLRLLGDDPDLTHLELQKVSRALDDAGLHKKFKRFWKKRLAFRRKAG